MDIIIKTETPTGKVLDEILLQIAQERCTIAELIALRVAQQVRSHNQQWDCAGYMQDTETLLNTQPSRTRYEADVERETYRAWEAFKQNQLILLVDNQQQDDLQQEILLHPDTNISFIRLTPLVGG